ncbi:MAG: glycosyltransferase family 39 protein [Planctomycetes bacterium]|nr:glycosyltransferase family 39 protein [Planctomycetota bacterium]
MLASRWLGFVVLALAFAALTWWSYGTWPDVLVDFGRECYAPWRLAEGDVLYRDLAWFNGPLSPYFNALGFELCGASLRTLFVVNLALFALLVTLLWSLVARASSALAATVACLVVLALCGFGQLVGIGNYNFVAPYSHEVTHGLLCALAALVLAERGAESDATSDDARRAGGSGWLGAGICLGLAWLTKVELALAATAALGVRVALERRGRPLALVLGGALLPLLAATALLARPLGLGEAWRAATTAWRGLAANEAASLDFYRVGMGLDAPVANLGQLALVAGGWLALAALVGGVSFALRATALARPVGAACVALVAASGAWFAREHVHWLALARPLPLVALGVWLTGWVARRDAGRRPGAHARLALATLAFVLLSKMILNARIEHYGFALALPALALAVMLAVHDLPLWVGRFGGAGRAGNAATLARAFALAGAAVIAGAFLELSNARLAKKTVVVGSGADRFQADLRGEFLNRALTRLAEDDPALTLAVFPEGVMANYLARRKNPTPFVNFMPPELVLFGETRIVQTFQATPPDRVLLVHKDTTEYGFPLFGADYGRELANWIVQNFRPLGPPLGDPPLVPGSRFGIQVLGR